MEDLPIDVRPYEKPMLQPMHMHMCRKPRVLVLGHKGHGKDTFADFLFNNSLEGTTKLILSFWLLDHLNHHHGTNYKNVDEALADKEKNREKWFKAILEHETASSIENSTANEILNYQRCYVGLRQRKLMEDLITHNLVDYIFWVDAFNRCEPEPLESMDIDYHPCRMIWIDNNQGLAHLELQAMRYREILKLQGAKLT